MTEREASLYRWLETFTLTHHLDPADPLACVALDRGYVARVKRPNGGEVTGEYQTTPAGWDWFAVRSAQIVAKCRAGQHEFKEKTPFCKGRHCRWCGDAEVGRLPGVQRVPVGTAGRPTAQYHPAGLTAAVGHLARLPSPR